jgi:hypothetical protein
VAVGTWAVGTGGVRRLVSGGALPPPVLAALASVPQGEGDAYKALAAAVWAAFLLPPPRGTAE